MLVWSICLLEVFGTKIFIARCERGLDKTKSCNDTFCYSKPCGARLFLCLSLSLIESKPFIFDSSFYFAKEIKFYYNSFTN